MSSSEQERFKFIKNETLRKNINIVFSDIVDFTTIIGSYEENIQNNIRRAIILYTAAIIEALLHHLVEELVKPLEFSENEWVWEKGDPHVYKKSKDSEIIIGTRRKKKKKITKTTQFQAINQIALENEIVSKKLYEEIEDVRKLRNGIHLISLQDIENKYSKELLNKVFETARKLVKIAETLDQ